MLGKRAASRLAVGLLVLVAGAYLWAADKPTQTERRDSFTKAFRDGNFKVAYEGLRALAVDPTNDDSVVNDLNMAVQCLQNLGRIEEIDGLREASIAAHGKNWRLLQAAALSYQQVDHHGFQIAGKFERGPHRGGGKLMNASARDRVRALQLLNQALPLAAKDADKAAAAQFHLQLANTLLTGAGGGHEPWRLQYLSDLSKLPDYEEGYVNHWGRGRWRGDWGAPSAPGAPVDDQNKPIYYLVPKSWETATSDGERWRWALARVAELDPGRTNEVDMTLAGFWRGQLGVQTLGWGYRPPAGGDAKAGTFALHTLKDDESIARLATGPQRFAVPDEFNWIKIWERVAGRDKSGHGQQARDSLAQEYEDRRQYVKAASAWRKALEEYGDPGHRQQRLDQIVKNWGRFEPRASQAAGVNPSVDFRFRNGTKVTFEAHALKVEKLLADVQEYLKSNPGRLDWQKMQIGDIGYRLVQQNEVQYQGDLVASWAEDLKPRPAHVDDRVTFKAPFTKPGAYLVTAKLADGNVSRIILWLADTAVIKKQLDGKVLYYAADAVTGNPVAKASLEYFGWRHEHIKDNNYRVVTKAFTKATDADGQVVLGPGELETNYNWLVTARKAKDAQGGGDRFAYLGFAGVWYGGRHDADYNATRTFLITDRPVYRPEHAVQFKAWVRHAKYDQPDVSDFAGRAFNVRIQNPKGDVVFQKTYTADEYAGLDGEWKLPRDATLGMYQLYVDGHGGASFRVEEYKKPEFEVVIDAPKEPVALGEKIEATIRAKYYFGAPVTKGKVKYKVLRTQQTNTWYPADRWDWFYGTGYWWFAADYEWYPGWREWGCCRPIHPWWGQVRQDPPEVVIESETEVGPDGTVKVTIDTAAAKELHGDQDHSFAITAEVTDESRRTIVGAGTVLASRKPFSVFAWVDRGYYRAGDAVRANFKALTLDRKPVSGTGELKLFALSYGKDGTPEEKVVETWKLDTDAQGLATQQLKAARPGQYRLSYQVTDAKKHTIEGAYVFVVRGGDATDKQFRFNDVELVPDRREYAPGDKAKVMINTNRQDSTALLFVRPSSGVYLAPRVVRIKGMSAVEEIDIAQKDMPNFFVEVVTVHGGRVHSEVREIAVPPEKRVLNVEVTPDQTEYKPGQKATVKVKLTDHEGKPFVGSTVVSVYDRSVDYISGGSNVPEIKEFFWKWRRHHHPQTEHNLNTAGHNLLRVGEVGMANLGMFGAGVVEEMGREKGKRDDNMERASARGTGGPGRPAAPGAAMMGDAKEAEGGAPADALKSAKGEGGPGEPPPAAPGAAPTVRKNFADTAFWTGKLTTGKDGTAEVTFTMPEQLTGWKVRVWGLGHGTKVGQGEVEVTTKKDLLVRLQSPRFFTQKDEVVLSANVHNYLKAEKEVAVTLETEGGTLALLDSATRKVKIPAGGETRVDWRVKVTEEGIATVRMKAVADTDSDAMQMTFPAQVHGMLKMEPFSAVIRPEQTSTKLELNVPKERRAAQTLLEVQYSPTLAGAMVDALPYLVEYPYGCTEQTLNRFVPTVITQRTLQRMKVDLADVKKKRTNLNPAELGEAKDRAAQWKRYDRNPVFDEAEVVRMTKAGVDRLVGMQCGDGGWGWFSGFGEQSWPHTTATVVHGLSLAKANDVAIPAGVIERGVAWLKAYQAEQVRRLGNAVGKVDPWKDRADDLDALVYMVLRLDGGHSDANMREFLYRDRVGLSVYAKAMFGLALHKENEAKKLAMILENIEQFVVEDKENQTAYLKLPAGTHWWYWYGSEIESNAYYLKLLSAATPKDPKAAGLVKYLLANRKHATYWSSTRDTAICLEAMADFMKATGEDKPDLTVEVWLDGKKVKEAKIDSTNLFTFDNRLALAGEQVTDGKHTVEIRKKGTGPVYVSAYLTNFTLEDFITKAGLEVKVERKYYKLVKVDARAKVPGVKGRPIDQKVEKFERVELKSGATLESGDLVEVELELESKNDYEYLLFEDPRAAGFEPVVVRSGYGGNEMGAYVEVRDDRTCFFVRALARGKHSMSYRLRAEIPGKFSALPARAAAMYAPELKGNSDEMKLGVTD